MKRCPECGRDYDNSMMFCLDDGAELLYGPGAASGAGDDPATAILSEPRSADMSDARTQAQALSTDQTTIFPTAAKGPVARRRALDKRLILAPFALAVVVLGAFAGYRYFKSATVGPINSIAVLPLTNAGGEASSEYLTDGISESLINSLSKLPGLRVVPRSTVFRYKGQVTDAADLGQRLGVQAVLTGRVLQRGDMLDVQAELIDISNNAQMWGERYSRRVIDLQDLQKEIANAVALRLSRADQPAQQLPNTYIAKSEAYEEYLRGQYAAANEGILEGSMTALAHFQRAAELDPNFAPAHAGVADMYTQLSSLKMPPNEAMPKAKDAVLKALALDPSLADAHRSLAQIYWWGDWNFSGADGEFRRAIELNKNDPRTYIIYGNFLARFARNDEAEATVKRAVELDPTSPSSTAGLCRVYLYSRRFDDLLPVSEKLVAAAPDNPDSYYLRGIAYLQKGRNAEAVSDLQRASEESDYLSSLGYAYAVMGRRDDALRVIGQIRSLSAQNRFVSPYEIARVYAGLGDKEAAFESLEEAFKVRDDGLTRMKYDIFMDGIRSEPRFGELMKRVGLP